MWYDKYRTTLGDPSLVPAPLFEEISRSIVKLRGDDPSPEISVVVIAYNEERRIIACLWSLSQTISNHSIEIIVVDNASKDSTGDLIKRCGARLVYQPRQGVGFARQAGLEAALGEYIISADADTFYPPLYIDTMIKHLKRPGLSSVFVPYWFIPDGNKSRISLDIYSTLRDWVNALRSIKRPELAAGGAAMAFRRKDALAVGWKTDIRRGEDGSMIVGLKRFGKVKFIRSSKVHIRSTSRTLDSDGSMLRMVGKRIVREMRRFGAYFKSKKEYPDQDYNKLPPQKPE